MEPRYHVCRIISIINSLKKYPTLNTNMVPTVFTSFHVIPFMLFKKFIVVLMIFYSLM